MSTTSIDPLKQRKKYYIYDLPYPERRKLCQILDADGKWEELGGRFMEVKQIELSAFGRAIFHKGSPTSDLLDWFGRGNGTIDQLFVYLSHMNHQWAMTVISAYVSPKYHCLLNQSIMDTASIEIPARKHSLGNAAPSAPSRSKLQSNSELLGATGMDSYFVKPKVDTFNFNKSNSNPSLLPSKITAVPYDSQTNGFVLHQQRKQASPTMNGTASKVLNECQSSTGIGNTEMDGAYKQAPNSSSDAEPQLKCTKHYGAKPSMKLNIPVSSPQNGAVKKLNKVTESKVPLDTSECSENVMKIPYAEMVKATSNFQKENILGQGGFGIVYKANWKGSLVAVKRISPKNKTDSRFAGQVSFKQLQTEMKVLYRCRSDNILALYGVSVDGPEPCLVYQFMVNGSLEDRLLIKGHTKPLTWDQRSKIAWGTAKGLNFLHSVPDKPLIHGDIKSANILLDKDMDPKIGDFGLARVGPSDDSTHVKVSSVHGTQVYLPPEYLRNSQLSEKVDVYSYGIVLLEIATGLRAYNDKLQQHKHLLSLVNHKDPEDYESLRDEKAGTNKQSWFLELLRIGKQCSSLRKSERPTMAEILEKFDIIDKRIEVTEKIRRLSIEMDKPQPPALSPMELQLLYDLKNGPEFPSIPTGVQGPPPYIGADIPLPSVLPSIHTSEIREPPSQDFICRPFLGPGSSTVATNGSQNGMLSSSPVPILTELGTANQPPGSSTMAGMIITPKREESSMNLFDGDGDSGDDEDDEDNESYEGDERLR